MLISNELASRPTQSAVCGAPSSWSAKHGRGPRRITSATTMRRGGRAFGLLIPPVVSVYLITLVAGFGGRRLGVPVEIKVWDAGRTPLAHMVDVSNGFGLKVLAEHNFLNDNNIAFSPYGLMGIMVALYEGVDGESSYQIQRGMQLPWNRNVMRIGFRDIHRALKTYFVPEEGFLAGLALNNENVTFNDAYKKILRFYGFDLENDQLPILPPENGTANDSPAATTTMGTTPGSETTMTTAMSTEGAPTKEDTTANPDAETVDLDVRTPTEATTMSPSSAPNAESTPTMTTAPTIEPVTATTSSATETTTTTIAPATESGNIASTAQESTTILISTASSSNMPMTPEPSTTIAIVIAPSSEADAETIAQQTSQATSALTEQPTAINEVVSSTLDMGIIDSTSESSTANINQMIESTITTAMSEALTEQLSTVDVMTTATSTTVTESTLETLQRRKKSIVDFIFTNPPYVDDYSFYRSYKVGPDIPGPGFDDQMFLANGLKSVQVTYMRYDSVLEHAYLPHLEASALRLPLDSDRYYLLVVLPNRASPPELGWLLGRMARESDLADVYAALRPRRVRATVPSFIVKGHVTLTTDLQKLGIRDVFEPRQRDFTPMTRQPGVYVRSIEQAVSVAIRKYRPTDHKKNRYVHNREPVTFHATYPFLYFVMDANIHVALMAGKMVDPLNSRIL